MATLCFGASGLQVVGREASFCFSREFVERSGFLWTLKARWGAFPLFFQSLFSAFRPAGRPSPERPLAPPFIHFHTVPGSERFIFPSFTCLLFLSFSPFQKRYLLSFIFAARLFSPFLFLGRFVSSHVPAKRCLRKNECLKLNIICFGVFFKTMIW